MWLGSLDIGPVISEIYVEFSLSFESSVDVASARSPNVATWVLDVDGVDERSFIDPIDGGAIPPTT